MADNLTPEQHLQAFLDGLGFAGDPEMSTTANRVKRFLEGYAPSSEAPPEVSICATRTQQPVVVRELPFYSLCAHHLLPFFGRVNIGYIPGEKVVGLGSLPRLVKWVSTRPQVQERMVEELADALMTRLQPTSLVVVCWARHLCVEMRGSQSQPNVEVISIRGETGPMADQLFQRTLQRGA